MAGTTYEQITRRDLAGWDAECIDLVMEAQSFGWTGRMSSKGHMILRAPDNDTTMSVSRRWSNGRSGPNMRANFDRWLKGQGTEVSFEQFSDAWDAVEQERFISTMIGGLTDAANGFGGDDAERTKVIYRNILESPKVAPFAFRLGVTESRINDFGILIGYDDNIADENRRPWNVNWAIYDRRSMEVIDFGGPRLMDGQPWDEEIITLLVVEKVRREREEEAAQAEPEPVDEERPYVCEICDRRFLKPHNLGRHMATIHKPEQAFVGDPMEDGLDDLLTPSEPVTVQMDDHLTVVADLHTIVPDDGQQDARSIAEMMVSAIDGLGVVAARMAFLESERMAYEARLTEMSEHYDALIVALTDERDTARESLAALKSLVADL